MAIDPHMQDIDDEPLDDEFEDRELVRAVARPHHVAPAQLIGLPVAAPAAARRGRNGGRAPGSDYPLRPLNAYYFDRRAAFEATVSVASEAGRQADAQEALNDAVGAVIDGLPNGEAVSTVIKNGFANALEPVVGQLKRIAKGVNANNQPIDNALLICVLAFDSDGRVFDGTVVGNALIGCKVTHIDELASMATSNARDAEGKRKEFVDGLTKTLDPVTGFPQPVSEDDVRRLFVLAPVIRKVIRQIPRNAGTS